MREEGSLLTTDEVAKYLNIPKRTLEDWRYKGKGPSYFKVGGVVRYKKEWLMEWLEERAEG